MLLTNQKLFHFTVHHNSFHNHPSKQVYWSDFHMTAKILLSYYGMALSSSTDRMISVLFKFWWIDPSEFWCSFLSLKWFHREIPEIVCGISYIPYGFGDKFDQKTKFQTFLFFIYVHVLTCTCIRIMQTFRKSKDKRKEGKRRKAGQNIRYNESCPEIFQNTCIIWTT